MVSLESSPRLSLPDWCHRRCLVASISPPCESIWRQDGDSHKDGKTVSPGGTSTDTLTLKPGKYTFYCPVPGHRAAGMVGTLTVQ